MADASKEGGPIYLHYYLCSMSSGLFPSLPVAGTSTGVTHGNYVDHFVEPNVKNQRIRVTSNSRNTIGGDNNRVSFRILVYPIHRFKDGTAKPLAGLFGTLAIPRQSTAQFAQCQSLKQEFNHGLYLIP